MGKKKAEEHVLGALLTFSTEVTRIAHRVPIRTSSDHLMHEAAIPSGRELK